MSTRLRKGKHQGYSAKSVKHDERVRYVRFVVPKLCEDSQMELGLFQAIAELRTTGQLAPHEEEEDERIGRWFNEHLEKPTRFTASKPPYYRRQSKAISWFKDSAHEHIAQMRSLAAILEHHGIRVRVITAKRVGYVCYEDEYQVTAEAFGGEEY